jgi:hypothetical protein
MKPHSVDNNRLCGKRFEATVLHRARVSGYLCIKNPLAFQPIGNGKSVAVPAELDFTLCNGRGQVAFVDAKVINRKSIPRSLFKSHQVLRSYKYNCSRVPSGFVVLFQPLGQVYFISGLQMYTARPGESVPAASGVLLGGELDFKLGSIFYSHLNFAATF